MTTFAVPSILPTKTEKNNSFFGGKAQPFFQRKLTIGSPNDVFEQEADATADRVMRSQGTSQPFFGKGLGAEIIHRKCAACEQEEKYLHKKGTDALAGMDAPSSVHEVISSSGQKMDFNTQNFMENRFGHDFSQIQIHTDSKAAASATAIQAKAYAAGNHVVFNTGEYAPHTQQGKHLLAHELTHTIQQGKGIERKVQRSWNLATPFPGERPTDGNCKVFLGGRRIDHWSGNFPGMRHLYINYYKNNTDYGVLEAGPVPSTATTGGGVSGAWVKSSTWETRGIQWDITPTDNCPAFVDCLKSNTTAYHSAGHPYHATDGPNSNSFAIWVLRQCGLAWSFLSTNYPYLGWNYWNTHSTAPAATPTP